MQGNAAFPNDLVWNDVKVFISYRRSDTQDLAGRIADRLSGVDGIDDVFLDVNAIRAGDTFKTQIERSIQRADVFLVVIGNQWRCPGADGAARIFDDDDLVRAELCAALERNIRVLPVLVNGATMPTAEELPDDLARLPDIDAAELDHVSFERDIDALIGAVLQDPTYQRTGQAGRRSVLTLAAHSLLGGALAAAAIALLALLHFTITDGRSLDQTLGGLENVIVLGVIIVVSGAALPIVRRYRKK